MRINAFLIGAQKAGSTSVFDWLGQHPSIYAPTNYKDVHLFSSPPFQNKLEEELASFFEDFESEKIILHGAVNYMLFPETLEKIKKHNAQAKLIVLLRNPIHRAYSAYKYFVKNGNESRSFEQALEDEENIWNNGSFKDKSNLTYFHHGLYAKQLKNVYEHFNKEQVYISFFEDVIKNSNKEITKIFKFLGVQETQNIEFRQKNRTGVIKNNQVNKRLNKGINNPVGNIIKKVIGPQTRKRIKEQLMDMNTSKKSYSQLDKEIEKKLTERFQQDIKQLSMLLNIDLYQKWDIQKLG